MRSNIPEKCIFEFIMQAQQITLKEILGIKHPIIMAPMFLVSNVAMVKAAMQSGITGAIPALNYRTDEELRAAIKELKKEEGVFGINLIVNKSNIHYKRQLETCLELGVDFFITSLGNPKETIERSHEKGIKVFCDVTDLKYAQKVEAMGADGVIAVNKQAGGHAGQMEPRALVDLLKENCNIPIIAAGGVGDYASMQEKLGWGCAGASVGSIFIASEEAGVSSDYKQAIVDYGKDDIVMTTKLSGTPCTVIKTPYVEKIGTEQSWLERTLNKNKKLKKWVKAIVFARGMKKLQNAAFSATYKTLWCAGPSIEYVEEVLPVKKIVDKLTVKKEVNV